MVKQTVLCFLFLLFQLSCKQSSPINPSPAFYHWQQKLDLSLQEQQFLADLQVTKLYLRLFDLDLNDSKTAVIPFSVLDGAWPTNPGLEIIPTFFITNRSMENQTPEQIDSLAAKLVRKAIGLLKDKSPGIKIDTWQLDCDWTKSTKDMYFRLVEQVKERLLTTVAAAEGIKISCTIRLHQIKYAAKTGVPPADRGMLMFYNMDNVADLKTENSIIDLEVAKQYLVGFDRYPLSLDLALPVFSWAVWIRESKILGLLYPFDPSVLKDEDRVKPIGPQQFQLLKSTYLDGRYLYEGDQLRLESASPELLLQAMDLLKVVMPSEERTLAFYALDSTMLKNYSKESLQQIINSWNPEN